MIRILTIIIGFVVYGSLYPWQYRPGRAGMSALQVLLHSWPAVIPRQLFGDIVVNLLLYIPLGMFAFFAFDRHSQRWLRFFAPGLLACALSTSMELLQVFDQTRDPSLLDVLDNTIGGIVGTVLGLILRSSLSGGVYLVLHWLGLQLCLLFTLWDGRRAPTWPRPLEAISQIIAWGVVLVMLSTLESERPPKWMPWLAAAFTMLLAVRGLSPFHFQPQATPFTWMPFLVMLKKEWILGLPVFLEKSFYYGAAIWLLHAAGIRLRNATGLVAILLLAMEVAQRYLPGRTPESTDPLLAVVLGFVLLLIEQDYHRVKRFDAKGSDILKVQA